MGSLFTVILPDIGEGVAEGEIVEWLKKEGDSIAQDEPVVVVMTDKATVELPSPYPGKLAKQYYHAGQVVKVGKPLYAIALSSEVEVSTKEAKEELKKELVEIERSPFRPVKDRALAIPKVRRLCHELGLDIDQISGSGKDGRVILKDLKSVQTSVVKPPSLPEDVVSILTGVRYAMAKKMALSKQMAAHFSYFEQVDATRLIKLREHVKQAAEKEHLHVTFLPFLIRALSLCLNDYPIFNSSLLPDHRTLVTHQEQHVGIAMNSKEGLIVPVLKSVQQMKLPDIIRAFEALKERSLGGQLTPQEMRDATITISNFGVLGSGGRWATPVLNYPEVAILAVNRLQKQPVIKNEEIVVRDCLHLCWSFDHRLIDGDLAAHFSHRFAELLQNPAQLT